MCVCVLGRCFYTDIVGIYLWNWYLIWTFFTYALALDLDLLDHFRLAMDSNIKIQSINWCLYLTPICSSELYRNVLVQRSSSYQSKWFSCYYFDSKWFCYKCYTEMHTHWHYCTHLSCFFFQLSNLSNVRLYHNYDATTVAARPKWTSFVKVFFGLVSRWPRELRHSFDIERFQMEFWCLQKSNVWH